MTPADLRRHGHEAAHSADWGPSPPLWLSAMTQADYEAEAYLMESGDTQSPAKRKENSAI